MQPDPGIDGYIRANRERYTREAITDQLIAAGHDPDAIEAAWERAGAPPPPPFGWVNAYAWTLYVIGALLVAAALLLGLGLVATGPGGERFFVYAAAVVIAYGVLGWLARRGLLSLGARLPRSGWSALLLGLLVPIVYVAIVAGSCFGLSGLGAG